MFKGIFFGFLILGIAYMGPVRRGDIPSLVELAAPAAGSCTVEWEDQWCPAWQGHLAVWEDETPACSNGRVFVQFLPLEEADGLLERGRLPKSALLEATPKGCVSVAAAPVQNVCWEPGKIELFGRKGKSLPYEAYNLGRSVEFVQVSCGLRLVGVYVIRPRPPPILDFGP